MTDRVSVVIPARYELYLTQTVNDIFRMAAGDVEVIVILDGYWPKTLPQDNPRLTIVHRDRRGMRASINAAVAIAKGKYILKADAHCLFAKGFDETLKECDDNWVVIPRRYALDAEKWTVKNEKIFVDYEYLVWPYSKKFKRNHAGLHAWAWDERIINRIDKLLDENLTFQGSCYFMTKEHFVKRLGNLQNDGYGTFIGEAQEIGLKTWLGGGKVMTNKKTWYAHLWKGQPYRTAHLEQMGVPYARVGGSERKAGNDFAIDYWLNNRWAERKHDLSWLIERFAPFPTSEQWMR